RAGKALRNAPPEFATFRASAATRTPAEILAHMGDLFDWACALADGRHHWRNSTPLKWEQEVTRFFAGLKAFDDRLVRGELQCSEERLFQGPVADALWHAGQIAMLRRMAGCPVKGENYFGAKIETGHVGVEQAAPVFEFE